MLIGEADPAVYLVGDEVLVGLEWRYWRMSTSRLLPMSPEMEVVWILMSYCLGQVEPAGSGWLWACDPFVLHMD